MTSRTDRKRCAPHRPLACADSTGDAAGRDGPQPVGRQRPARPAPTTSSARARRTRSPARPASKIGTVAVETPPLPDGSLTGDVYVGKQLSRDPASGDEYRIFVEAESDRYGVSARLIGNVSADPQTGRLTTTFAENPQVPFSSFRLQFDGGPQAALTSPPTCGPNYDRRLHRR